MAHVVEAGVYEFGIRVVLDADLEALWDLDGAAGLDAEIVSEGVLVGFIPHVPGSENFTEDQLVNSIATTDYTLGSLSVPTGHPVTEARESGEVQSNSVVRRQRRAHWIRRSEK
ncbi:hypothetical protein AB0N06_27465 [Streptomyces sp. NPDC051020]|uniref:hypothetical protein n=1 Tax=Streptomyces sp. NPDC051020 TaxID=3155409 RepID=UPI0034471AE7